MIPTEYLKVRGWSEEAARGICVHINPTSIRGGVIPEGRWGRFHAWCSAHERNIAYLTSALAFLTYELQNSYQGLGVELNKAVNVEMAADAVAPYFGRDG